MGDAWHRGNVRVSHPAAPGSILGLSFSKKLAFLDVIMRFINDAAKKTGLLVENVDLSAGEG